MVVIQINRSCKCNFLRISPQAMVELCWHVLIFISTNLTWLTWQFWHVSPGNSAGLSYFLFSTGGDLALRDVLCYLQNCYEAAPLSYHNFHFHSRHFSSNRRYKKCNVLWFASCCSLFTFHSTDDAQGPLAIRARRAVYGSARQEENLHLTGSMKGSAT